MKLTDQAQLRRTAEAAAGHDTSTRPVRYVNTGRWQRTSVKPRRSLKARRKGRS